MDAAWLRYCPAQGRGHPKFATAKVERTPNGSCDRSQGRERQAERGGDFNEGPSL